MSGDLPRYVLRIRKFLLILLTGIMFTFIAEDNSEKLLKVTISLLSNELCKKSYQFDAKFRNGFDSQSMVCAGDQYDAKDTCQVV